MKKWFDLSSNRKKQIFDQIAAREGLPSVAIEKDWWVTLTLKCIFELPSSDQLVFKGGTSLSKGWSLIERFSEDVDLAVDREQFGFEGELGSSQTTKLRKTIRSFVKEELAPAISEKLNEYEDVEVKVEPNKNSDADPSRIEIFYPAVTEELPYVPSRVLVEVSARSLFEPYEVKRLDPLIKPVFSSLDIDFDGVDIPCVLPKRTFLEKVFLLHEEFQKNPDELRAERLSRHIYDVEKMMDEEHGKQALEDVELYGDIINHRQNLIGFKGIDYDSHWPGTINLIPPDAARSEWKKDYKNMQESMIYGDTLNFEELLERMYELMERINSLDFEKPKSE